MAAGRIPMTTYANLTPSERDSYATYCQQLEKLQLDLFDV